MSDELYINAGLAQFRQTQIDNSNKSRAFENKKRCGKSDEKRQIEKACKEMESIFIYHLLKEMRATIPKSGLMGGESVKEMYNHMTDSQLARKLSDEGGIGLSDMLYRELNRLADNGGKSHSGKID